MATYQSWMAHLNKAEQSRGGKQRRSDDQAWRHKSCHAAFHIAVTAAHSVPTHSTRAASAAVAKYRATAAAAKQLDATTNRALPALLLKSSPQQMATATFDVLTHLNQLYATISRL